MRAVRAAAPEIAQAARLVRRPAGRRRAPDLRGGRDLGPAGHAGRGRVRPHLRHPPVAGGGRSSPAVPHALTHAVEGAEDNAREAEQRMRRAAVGPKDVVLCIAASGVTPFVRAALEYAHLRRASTVFITCAQGPAHRATASPPPTWSSSCTPDPR